MTKNKIIPFQTPEIFLRQAEAYLNQPDLILADKSKAVPMLQKAFQFADLVFKKEIMLNLVSLVPEEISCWLYKIMTDEDQEDELRYQAAIDLSLSAEHLENTTQVIETLIMDARSDDPDIRLLSTIALGWRENHQGVLPLLERVFDKDEFVQQAAINSLTNIRDDRVLPFLLDRLESAPQLQKRSILSNLYYFSDQENKIKPVYLKMLESSDPELRLDALANVITLYPMEEMFRKYKKLLADPEVQIRKTVLRTLLKQGTVREFKKIEATEIEGFIHDQEDMEIKKQALNLLRKIQSVK